MISYRTVLLIFIENLWTSSKIPLGRVLGVVKLRNIGPRGSKTGQRGFPGDPRGSQRGEKEDQEAPRTTPRGPIGTHWGPFGS